jgi:hypothetical protein
MISSYNSCYAIARHIPGPVAHCVAGWERIRFRYYTSRGMTLCLLTHDAWTPAPTMYGRLRPRCMDARAHDVWTPAPTMYGRLRPRCIGERLQQHGQTEASLILSGGRLTLLLLRRRLDPNVINLRAESPIINSAGQRPADRMRPIYQALLGEGSSLRRSRSKALALQNLLRCKAGSQCRQLKRKIRQQRWEEIPCVGISANSVGKKFDMSEFSPTALGRNPTRRRYRAFSP